VDALDPRDQFCFSEQSLAATDPSSGFKFQFTQAPGGDKRAVFEMFRAERKVLCRPCDSRTPEERREAMRKEAEENVREWFRKKGIKVQSRGSPA
jgi:hypothetical protein